MTTITDETSINSSKVTKSIENSDPAGIRNPLRGGGGGRVTNSV